ncbi:MAG: low molecular weight phosphatase family protein [Microbacterium sp.]|uniref:arsenate reductase/protein-tyrosine-phosphatase family protein n=1 Tax=Microbacterium sp. TaxID=51671 RepID=UPI0039E39F99
MFTVLTVCTGNICRSPLAALVLRMRLADLDATVESAGTRGLPNAAMPEEAVQLAVEAGVSATDAAVHRSRFLAEHHLTAPDLILAMSREHRREIAELAPARLRSTFTLREFARLQEEFSDHELRQAADAGGVNDSMRVRAMAATVAGARGVVLGPADPAEDDVIDPFGRSWETYQRSAQQLIPALDGVVRALRLSITS